MGSIERKRDKSLKFIVYKDDAQEFRWRLVARNGRTVADSGEGYTTRSGALKAVKRLNEEGSGSMVVVAPELTKVAQPS